MANTKITLGFIAGAAIGAIAGILLAPDSGAATRKKIIDKSGDLKDAVKDGITGFLDKLQKGVDEEVKQEERNTVPKMNTDII
jgi:gas vesicle protein